MKIPNVKSIGRVALNSALIVFFCGQAIVAEVHADDSKYEPVMATIQLCESCHGEGGNSQIAANPVLSGQHFYYTYVQLKDFKAGRRENSIMSPLASTLEKDQMKLIAEYFSKQQWPERDEQELDNATVVMAKKVINAGQCVACHRGGFEGDSRVPRSNGQHLEYLEKTLLDFKTKARNNSPSKGTLMASFSDEELVAVAKYLAALRGAVQ